MLECRDLRVQLNSHVIDQVDLRGQIVSLTQRGANAQVAVADLREHILEASEGACHPMHQSYRVDAMDEDHEAGAERPWPESGVEAEEVVGDDGSLLPGQGWVVERPHERFEHRNGQQYKDDRRIDDDLTQHADLQRVRHAEPAPRAGTIGLRCCLNRTWMNDGQRGNLAWRILYRLWFRRGVQTLFRCAGHAKWLPHDQAAFLIVGEFS